MEQLQQYSLREEKKHFYVSKFPKSVPPLPAATRFTHLEDISCFKEQRNGKKKKLIKIHLVNRGAKERRSGVEVPRWWQIAVLRKHLCIRLTEQTVQIKVSRQSSSGRMSLAENIWN